jgi:hypothetical protein
MPDQPGENEGRDDSSETSPRTIRDDGQKDYVAVNLSWTIIL